MLKLGYVGLEERSPGQVLETSCILSMTFQAMFETRSVYQILEYPCVNSRGQSFA